jgi:hypothetical protein
MHFIVTIPFYFSEGVAAPIVTNRNVSDINLTICSSIALVIMSSFVAECSVVNFFGN